MGCGGGQDEYDVGRRLLQGLEQCIEGRIGEHVDFVDDIDLVPGHRRGVADLLAKVPDIVDAAVAGRVDLYQVHRAALVDRQTYFAGVVGLAVLWRKAVQCLCKNTRGAGFAGAPGTAEQVSVSDTILNDRIANRTSDRLLAHELSKCTRTPFPVENFAHCVIRIRKPSVLLAG